MSEKETNQYKLKIALITDKNIELQQRIDKSIELTKNLLETENKGYYQIIFKEILKSLGDKENE